MHIADQKYSSIHWESLLLLLSLDNTMICIRLCISMLHICLFVVMEMINRAWSHEGVYMFPQIFLYEKLYYKISSYENAQQFIDCSSVHWELKICRLSVDISKIRTHLCILLARDNDVSCPGRRANRETGIVHSKDEWYPMANCVTISSYKIAQYFTDGSNFYWKPCLILIES